MSASSSRYRRLLSIEGMRALVAVNLLGRLPIGTLSLAIVLFVREETGSFATAGGVAAAFALAGGLCAPLQGRTVDSFGQTRVLVPLALVHASALTAVIALGVSDAPTGALAAAAAVAGSTIPPISACFRPLMMDLLAGDQDLLPTGFALDSILMEVVFIVGPLITATVVAAFSGAAAVATAAALGFVGTLAFATRPASRAWRGEPRTTGIAGALASAGTRTLTLAGLPIGICFGTLEVALPAFGAEHGTANLGGVLFTLLAAGSMAGGVAYGVAAYRLGSLTRGYLILVAALPATLALTVLADSVLVMVLLVPLAGSVIAPLTAAENQVLAAVAPAGSTTESYTWVIMATVVGVAVGNAAAGALVQASSWRVAVLAACGAAVLGAGLCYLRRGTLTPDRVAAA